ncbi:MAG: type II toxin-antitoxin system Phd/YefM family antitoxin [Dehalococcoidia bacterium]
MKRRVTAMEARKRLGELLESVYHRGDEVVIERAGKPMAVVIPAARYEAMERNRDELRKLIAEIRAANAADPPEEIYADVAAAVREVRDERSRKRTA